MYEHKVLEFDEAPECCPKCGMFDGWNLVYFIVDRHSPGYDPLIGLPATRERLRWACRRCGYSFFSKTKDAEVQPIEDPEE
jgi:rubrerythrin